MSDIAGVRPWSATWSNELDHISVSDFRIISIFTHGDKAHVFEPYYGPLSGPDLESAGPAAF